MKRPYGMAPEAWRAYVRACFAARIDPDRVSQTIGSARASAGYHKQDGTVVENGVEYDYTTAVDLSVHDLSQSQVHTLLEKLAEQGFAGWWRHQGSFKKNVHVHAVYAGLPMKEQLEGQITDWLHGLNGLAGHAHDPFLVPSERAKQHIRAMLSQI